MGDLLLQVNSYLDTVLKNDTMACQPAVLEFLGALHVATTKKPKYLPRLSIPQAALSDVVQPGDLFLFCTPGLLQKAYRTVKRCGWDHVGVVAEDRQRDTVLLEATQDGVQAYSLQERLTQWRKTYPDIQIAYRKLKAVRDRRFYRCIDHFVATNVGKEFSLLGYTRTVLGNSYILFAVVCFFQRKEFLLLQ